MSFVTFCIFLPLLWTIIAADTQLPVIPGWYHERSIYQERPYEYWFENRPFPHRHGVEPIDGLLHQHYQYEPSHHHVDVEEEELPTIIITEPPPPQQPLPPEPYYIEIEPTQPPPQLPEIEYFTELPPPPQLPKIEYFTELPPISYVSKEKEEKEEEKVYPELPPTYAPPTTKRPCCGCCPSVATPRKPSVPSGNVFESHYVQQQQQPQLRPCCSSAPQPCCPELSSLAVGCCSDSLPCCAPPAPPLPQLCCLPLIPLAPLCCPQPIACLRACPTCPCRQRLRRAVFGNPAGTCTPCSGDGRLLENIGDTRNKRTIEHFQSLTTNRTASNCMLCRSKNAVKRQREKRAGCIHCTAKVRTKRTAVSAHSLATCSRSCSDQKSTDRNKRSLLNAQQCRQCATTTSRFKREILIRAHALQVQNSQCRQCPTNSRVKRQSDNNSFNQYIEKHADEQISSYDSTFDCDKSCCDYLQCQSLSARRIAAVSSVNLL